MDITIVLSDSVNPTEYFCCDCLQLRLSLDEDKSHCGFCASEHIITGFMGELDKQALLNQYKH